MDYRERLARRCLQCAQWLWQACLLLNPYSLWRSDDFWARCMLWYCALRSRLTVDSEEKQRVLEWVRGKVTRVRPPTDLGRDWKDGIVMCALLEALAPNSCPRYDLLNPDNAVANADMAIKLIEMHLGIKPSLTADEMVNPSPSSERKLTVLLSQLKLASAKSILRKTVTAPLLLPSTPEPSGREPVFRPNQECAAKGMGLVLAVKGRKACFNIYLKSTSQLNIVIEIRGPGNSLCSERITDRSPKRKAPIRSSTAGVLAVPGPGSGPKLTRSGSLGDALDAEKRTVKIPFEYEIHSGKVAVGYVPVATGRHRLSIIWQGQHIMGSPYVVAVDDALEGQPEVVTKQPARRPPPVQIRPAESPGPSPPSTPEGLAPNQVSEVPRVSPTRTRRLGTVTRRRVLRHIVKVDGKDMVIEDSSPEEFASAVHALRSREASSRQLGRQYSLDSKRAGRGPVDEAEDADRVFDLKKWMQSNGARGRTASAPETSSYGEAPGWGNPNGGAEAARQRMVSFEDEGSSERSVSSGLNSEDGPTRSAPSTNGDAAAPATSVFDSVQSKELRQWFKLIDEAQMERVSATPREEGDGETEPPSADEVSVSATGPRLEDVSELPEQALVAIPELHVAAVPKNEDDFEELERRVASELEAEIRPAEEERDEGENRRKECFETEADNAREVEEEVIEATLVPDCARTLEAFPTNFLSLPEDCGLADGESNVRMVEKTENVVLEGAEGYGTTNADTNGDVSWPLCNADQKYGEEAVEDFPRDDGTAEHEENGSEEWVVVSEVDEQNYVVELSSGPRPTEEPEPETFPSVECRKQQFEEMLANTRGSRSVQRRTDPSEGTFWASPVRSSSYVDEPGSPTASLGSRSQSQGSLARAASECDTLGAFNRTREFWERNDVSGGAQRVRSGKSGPDDAGEFGRTVRERTMFWENIAESPKKTRSPPPPPPSGGGGPARRGDEGSRAETDGRKVGCDAAPEVGPEEEGKSAVGRLGSPCSEGTADSGVCVRGSRERRLRSKSVPAFSPDPRKATAATSGGGRTRRTGYGAPVAFVYRQNPIFSLDHAAVPDESSVTDTTGTDDRGYIDDEIPDYASILMDKYVSFTGLLENDRCLSRRELLGLDFAAGSDRSLALRDPFLKNDTSALLPRASACRVYGAGVYYGQVGTRNSFRVGTRGAGKGCLTVSVQGPGQHDVNEVVVSYAGDHVYEIMYDVAEPGYYVISVKWSEWNIPESPFICKVTF